MVPTQNPWYFQKMFRDFRKNGKILFSQNATKGTGPGENLIWPMVWAKKL
jgi:hypothetical protein